MNKNQLLTVLKINGLTAESSDEEISAVLHSARYSESEIERALLILKQKDMAQAIRADGLHTVFYTDSHLKPSEISGLLGIDIDIDLGIRSGKGTRNPTFTLSEGLLIIGFATGLAVMGIFIYMFVHDVGFFHPVMAMS